MLYSDRACSLQKCNIWFHFTRFQSFHSVWFSHLRKKSHFFWKCQVRCSRFVIEKFCRNKSLPGWEQSGNPLRSLKCSLFFRSKYTINKSARENISATTNSNCTHITVDSVGEFKTWNVWKVYYSGLMFHFSSFVRSFPHQLPKIIVFHVCIYFVLLHSWLVALWEAIVATQSSSHYCNPSLKEVTSARSLHTLPANYIYSITEQCFPLSWNLATL